MGLGYAKYYILLHPIPVLAHRRLHHTDTMQGTQAHRGLGTGVNKQLKVQHIYLHTTGICGGFL